MTRDSRSKIGMPDSLRGCTAFLAYFDILTVSLIHRLQDAAPPIAAIVLDPPKPVLSAKARSELAASLACIGIVIPCHEDPGPLLERLQPATIVHWETEDAERTLALANHVRTLYQSR